jgi:hypothetical protein
MQPQYLEVTRVPPPLPPRPPLGADGDLPGQADHPHRDVHRSHADKCWSGSAQGFEKNIYFSVGEVARDVEKKAERTDISNVWWLHVDIDPRAGEDIAQEQARALKLLQAPPNLPPPTVIVFSGGGYQASGH